LKRWNDQLSAKIKINGNELTPDDNFRQGTFRDTDGTRTISIWIKNTSTHSIKVEIAKEH
jgi:hypothetical protein